MTPPECDGCGFGTPEGSDLTLNWDGDETAEVRLCASCRRVVAKCCGVDEPEEKALVAASTDD